jgi:transcriptional regulator with XRE-family HTH domain
MKKIFDASVFLKNIENLRIKKGLNKTEFCQIVGIPNLFSRYEPPKEGQRSRKIKQPTLQTLEKIANTFHVSIESLLNENFILADDGKADKRIEAAAHDPQPAGTNNVVQLTPHQALVSRFRQADLAERINRILVDIETMDPDQLREIEAMLESKRRYLESRLASGGKTGAVSQVARGTESGAPQKTAAGGE